MLRFSYRRRTLLLLLLLLKFVIKFVIIIHDYLCEIFVQRLLKNYSSDWLQISNNDSMSQGIGQVRRWGLPDCYFFFTAFAQNLIGMTALRPRNIVPNLATIG